MSLYQLAPENLGMKQVSILHFASNSQIQFPTKEGGGVKIGTAEASRELGQVTGYLRRRLSSAAVRANIRCLHERMLMVGEGLGQAGKRRAWARAEEERSRLDREAQWLVQVSGRNLVRRGDFPTL